MIMFMPGVDICLRCLHPDPVVIRSLCLIGSLCRLHYAQARRRRIGLRTPLLRGRGLANETLKYFYTPAHGGMSRRCAMVRSATGGLRVVQNSPIAIRSLNNRSEFCATAQVAVVLSPRRKPIYQRDIFV